MVQPRGLIMTQILCRSNKSNTSSKCLGRDFSLILPDRALMRLRKGKVRVQGMEKKSSEKITHKEKEENQD